MKNANLTKALAVAACSALVSAAGAAGIANSAHDWSTEGWNLNKDLCGPCHMAHGSDPANQLIPLWSHETITANDFQLFESPHGTTMNQPRGASRACLSCHDGTLAYNQLKGLVPPGQTPQYVESNFKIGANHDLRGDHPISFDYVDAYNNSPTTPAKTLKAVSDPLTTTLPAGNNLIGQTVQQAFLKSVNGISTSVECTSCHDVHRTTGDSGVNSSMATFTQRENHNPLLVAYGLAQDGTGSSLCRSCHIK